MACRPALRPDLRKFADTASRGPPASNSMADRRGIPEWLRRPWARSVKFRQPQGRWTVQARSTR